MLLSLYPSDKVADSGVVGDHDGDNADEVSLSKLKTLKLLLVVVVELVAIFVTKLCPLESDTTNLSASFGLMLLSLLLKVWGTRNNQMACLSFLFPCMLYRVIVLRY